MTTYFALTIGPIFKTMAMARETRELWAASYIFSHFIEKLTDKLEKADCGTIVLPQKPKKLPKLKTKFPCGLYPDRVIIEVTNEEETANVLEKTINDFFAELTNKEEEALKFFNKYFLLQSLLINLPSNEDPVSTINKLLDNLELSCAFVPEFETDYLVKCLKEIKQWKGVYPVNVRFPSTLEIACADLFDKDKGQLPDYIKKSLKDESVAANIFEHTFNRGIRDIELEQSVISTLIDAFNPKNSDVHLFRNYHKNIAIVHADGDNLSKLLHAMYLYSQHKGISHLSGLLMKFGVNSANEIKDYGGLPVYMGGDDLLFFAPARKNERTIFHLIHLLDEKFKHDVLSDSDVSSAIAAWNAGATPENRRKEIVLGISFGISIAYYKFPLWESLETSRNNLFQIAKKMPGKNGLSFKVLKHSGQHYEALIGKEWKSFSTKFLYLLDEVIKSETGINKKNDINFLTSFQHKLDPLRPLIYRILVGRSIDIEKASFIDAFKNEIPAEYDRQHKLELLKRNFFNESTHKASGTKLFLDVAIELLLQLYRDMEDVYGNSNKTAAIAVDALFAFLRFTQLIIQPVHTLTK